MSTVRIFSILEEVKFIFNPTRFHEEEFTYIVNSRNLLSSSDEKVDPLARSVILDFIYPDSTVPKGYRAELCNLYNIKFTNVCQAGGFQELLRSRTFTNLQEALNILEEKDVICDAPIKNFLKEYLDHLNQSRQVGTLNKQIESIPTTSRKFIQKIQFVYHPKPDSNEIFNYYSQPNETDPKMIRRVSIHHEAPGFFGHDCGSSYIFFQTQEQVALFEENLKQGSFESIKKALAVLNTLPTEPLEHCTENIKSFFNEYIDFEGKRLNASEDAEANTSLLNAPSRFGLS